MIDAAGLISVVQFVIKLGYTCKLFRGGYCPLSFFLQFVCTLQGTCVPITFNIKYENITSHGHILKNTALIYKGNQEANG